MKNWSVMVTMAVVAIGANALAADEKTKAAGAPALKMDAPKPAATPVSTPPAAESKPVKTGGVSVEAKLCKNLANREPVDLTDSFKVADGQVITFSRVTGGAGTELHHVYFHGDKQLDDITLKINGSPWRTNSKKTLRGDQGMTGDWRVEVRDGSGAVLETLKFKVE